MKRTRWKVEAEERIWHPELQEELVLGSYSTYVPSQMEPQTSQKHILTPFLISGPSTV